MSETSLWPYTERNGVNASEDVDSLLRDPEVYLDEQEKTAVYEFARGLFDGFISEDLKVEPSAGEPVRDLQEIDNTSTAASHQSFYVDYFKTESAQADVAVLGLNLESEVSIREQLYRLAVDPRSTVPKVRKEIAARSLTWYKQELANRLQQPKENDGAQPDCEVVNVEFDPKKFFKKFKELQAYRVFYRKVTGELRGSEPTDENDAKRTVLDIYYARVNSLVAEMYPHMHDVSRQIEYMPLLGETFNSWRHQLLDAAPIVVDVKQRVEADREAQISSHLRRLDLLRFGAAQWEGEANYSPISHEVDQLATELSEAEAAQVEGTTQFGPETLEYMRSTKWDAAQMKQFCEAVLDRWEILSEHQADWDEVSERSGYAADDKWQIIISPKVSSLSVNGKKKTVTVPENFDRTLIQVSKAGALPGAAHELSHIWQHEYSFELAASIPLAKIKGKRYVTSFEMGGVQQEREIHTMVGQVRPTNVTYLRALQAKLEGANQTEAARVYAEAMGDGMTPDIAKMAGDNTLRLYRSGGYSSQALDYIEQELLLRSMSDLSAGQVRAVAIAGGSFSIRDAAALHRYGLLELPTTIRVHPAEDVMEVFLRDFYPGEID